MNENTSNLIYIPIQGVQDALKIDFSSGTDFPNVDDLLGVLRAELAPLEIWLKIAIEYYNKDRIYEFIEILKSVLDSKFEEYYKDSKLERIAMLTALASYSTQQGANEKDKTKKDEYFNNAISHFNKAIRIDSNIASSLTLVGRAILFLYKNEYDLAYRDLSRVVDEMSQSDPSIPTIPAKIGYACLLFNKGIYAKALEQYQKVIEQNPNYSVESRLGLAYCYFKLGRDNKAKESFQRVLELDEFNVEALTGLASVLFNQGFITDAMKLIMNAYKVSPTNSVVLNHLANHYFHKGDYSRVINLGQAAISNTEVAQIKAESYYQLGRAYHAMEKWGEALKHYYNASSKSPDFYLAHYGLGQIYIYTGEYDKAIQKFEQVLQIQPSSFETLQILGTLYKQSSNQSKELVAKTKSVLKKVTELKPNEYSNWIELAQILDTSQEETSQALDAYSKAITLMKNANVQIPLEIMNNIAVLKQQRGLFSEVEQIYLDIIKQSGHELIEFKASNITTTYNLARLYEVKNQPTRAVELYKGILKEHPTYIDCYLRLGAIAQSEGNYYEASEWFKDALQIAPNHAESWAMFGNLHQVKEEWYHAQKKFEQILEAVNKNETYASLSLGNIYYKAIHNNPEKHEKFMTSSENYYKRILTKSPNNIYAANGIGIIAAEKGNLSLSSEIFVQLREAALDVIPVSVNLAHVNLARGFYDSAIKLYEGCLKKIPGNNQKEIETILLYLSKAYFEAKRFIECKQSLKKALEISPNNPLLQFNYAVTVEAFTTTYLEKPIRNLEEFLQVKNELEQAKNTLFSLFNNIKPNPKLTYSTNKSKSHHQTVEALLLKCNSLYIDLEKEIIENRKKRDEAFEIEQKLKEEKRKQEEEIDLALKAKKEEELRKAEELQQIAKEHLLNYSKSKKEEEEAEKQKGSKKRKSTKEDDDFIEKNANSDSDDDRKKSKGKKNKEKDSRKERKKERKETREKRRLKRLKKENKNSSDDNEENKNSGDENENENGNENDNENENEKEKEKENENDNDNENDNENDDKEDSMVVEKNNNTKDKEDGDDNLFGSDNENDV